MLSAQAVSMTLLAVISEGVNNPNYYSKIIGSEAAYYFGNSELGWGSPPCYSRDTVTLTRLVRRKLARAQTGKEDER